jgi:hypothetical protein
MLIISISVAACKPSPEQQVAVEQDDTLAQEELHNSDYGIYFFDYPVKDNQVYSLQLHYPDRKARILSVESGPVLLEVELSEDLNLDEGYYTDTPEALFSFQDMNFDGYADVSFIRITGVSNVWSDYYLYDPKTRSWNFNEVLSEYSTLSIDEKNKQLTYYNKGGFGGAWYESGTLEWVNGKPVVFRKEEQTADGDNTEAFIRTIWTYANGELRIASKVRISETENGEKQCLLEGDWAEFDQTPFFDFCE